MLFLPQPFDPPRFDCSGWNKPLRHPFCSRVKTLKKVKQVIYNNRGEKITPRHYRINRKRPLICKNLTWFEGLFHYALAASSWDIQTTWNVECCVNVDCGPDICILLTQPEECRMQNKCGRIWNGARWRM